LSAIGYKHPLFNNLIFLSDDIHTCIIYIQTFSELFRFLSTLRFKPNKIAQCGCTTWGILLRRYIIFIGTVCKFFETNNIDPVVLQRDNIIYRNTETLERNRYRTLSHLHTHIHTHTHTHTPILLFATIVSEKIQH